ncbi:MAG TPA: HAMP domain-containing sensor histidine kinase [Gaiellaceae bacterium]
MPRPDRLELSWGVLALASLAAMVAYPSWETIPFHVIWISLTLLYGFRVWSVTTTSAVLGLVAIATGASIFADAFNGIQLWGELFEVPLMSAMFLAMVWHARRRQSTLAAMQQIAEERALLLDHEERLLQNVGHELRTPVTIARGHLELLGRRLGGGQRELAVALDELQRMERIVERVLLLARAEQPSSVERMPIRLVPFLEGVFMRWVDVAERAWRLGAIVDVTVLGDETWLCAALDALVENAVHYTAPGELIELSARGEQNSVVISVADTGAGVDPDVAASLFERFTRGGTARSQHVTGAGLGLAIVSAIARAHGGTCRVACSPGVGATFELELPLTQAAHADVEAAVGPVLETLAPVAET